MHQYFIVVIFSLRMKRWNVFVREERDLVQRSLQPLPRQVKHYDVCKLVFLLLIDCVSTGGG